jgi:hypothetical protein
MILIHRKYRSSGVPRTFLTLPRQDRGVMTRKTGDLCIDCLDNLCRVHGAIIATKSPLNFSSRDLRRPEALLHLAGCVYYHWPEWYANRVPYKPP